MARSVHTRPQAMRAAARLRAPYEPRGAHDDSGASVTVRTLKAQGIVVANASPPENDLAPFPLPRIRIQHPRPGTFHPLSRADILEALAYFGATCVYGLRSIELRDALPVGQRGDQPFGKLIVPGRIIIYAQPIPPWTLPGRLSATDTERFARAGAVVTVIGGGTQTVVVWPGAALRDFMRFDVLMHEIGHHIIQHNKGKRRVRILRTKDHEAWADAFARRCRAAWRVAAIAD